MRTRTILVAATLGACACVVGWRGKGPFGGDESLTGITSVRIEVPDTPIPLVGCAPMGPDEDQCGYNLVYEGVWHSTGGTESVAEDNAIAARLEFDKLGNFGTLRANVPPNVQGLVDLELTSVRMPADRDLELVTGLGDIDVSGIEGALLIDVDIGNVRIDCSPSATECGAGGVAVSTGDGRVKVYTRGTADIETDGGAVELYQYGQAERDVYIHTARGDVIVELAADANLDLAVKGDDIVVSTDTIDTVTRGSFTREVGNGTHSVEVYTRNGDVEIRRAQD